jgi:S1-C subfamily serine protease
MPSVAASAGLQEGDLIISANEAEIRSIESLHEQLLAARGGILELRILRGSERRSISLQVSEPPVG